MQYLGIDVHSQSCSWCALDRFGEVTGRGRISTTAEDLTDLVRGLGVGALLAGQEVGSHAYFVHDVLSEAGVELLSFNAHHLRMIASSRKKSDRRDAYWIAKALQTGMTPHPVYIPVGEIRQLRQLLAQRQNVKRDRARWALRARGGLKPYGLRARPGVQGITHFISEELIGAGVPTVVREGLELCRRQIMGLNAELKGIDSRLRTSVKRDEDVQRLMTIPGIGWLTATTIIAWVGDVGRFPTARHLAAYAGLVPVVRQSGSHNHLGHITKEGAPALRAALVQGAHSVVASRSPAAEPLRATFERVRKTRGRYKIATVALARHLLRIAYYILRDKIEYDARRLRGATR